MIDRPIAWSTHGPNLLAALEAVLMWYPAKNTVARMNLDASASEAAWNNAWAAIAAVKKPDHG